MKSRALVPLAVVKFCAEEVARQQDGPRAVWWMVEAWTEAHARWVSGERTVTPAALSAWGRLVSPDMNPGGFRGPGREVRIGDRLGTLGRDVGAAIEDLCHEIANGTVRTPEKIWRGPDPVTLAEIAYLRFEEIHPFRDGNGRTGKILYNWLLGRLEAPQMPPNFFNCANP